MNRLVQIIVFFLFGFVCGCNQKAELLTEIKEQFRQGNFTEAEKQIAGFKRAGISDSLLLEIEILEAKMERIRIDFSKTEDEIKTELTSFFPGLSDEQLRKWEADKSLEMKIIDGQRKYFKRAVRNLFRINEEAKIIWEAKFGNAPDSLDLFCLDHTAELVQKSENGIDLLENPARFKINFTITVKPDAVPVGELVSCWMPFPRESEPRQKNVKLISVNSQQYFLADNKNLQRSLFIEKVAEYGKPTVFQYSAEFEIAPQYRIINTSEIKPYDANSDLFKKYTAQVLPHIVFTDKIKHIADSLTIDKNNPYEKAKVLFYWIDQSFPWASALEYSTIECIPEYVLENGHGDCGMKTLLLMTMLRSLGIPCKWQSGWMLHPGEINLHDWCEVFYEGIGWVPVDQSFGLQDSEDLQLKEFYLSGIDEFRLIINDDFGNEFDPPKKFWRSEPIDFQRGELEWKGGNLYFNQWDYNMEVTKIN